MSILTDIRTAVANYATTNITTSITTLVPDVPGVINPPHEEFTFGVVATNAGAPDGIALVDVRYHLSASGAGVRLIVPPESIALARASGDATDPTLTPGDIVSTYFLFPITPDGQSLGIGDGDAINGLKGRAGASTGVGTLTVHVHVNPDVDELFPQERTSLNATRPVNVI